MACDVNVVFTADPSSGERMWLRRFEVTARWYDDSSIGASLR